MKEISQIIPLEDQLSQVRAEKQRLVDRLSHVCKLEMTIVTKISNERQQSGEEEG